MRAAAHRLQRSCGPPHAHDNLHLSLHVGDSSGHVGRGAEVERHDHGLGRLHGIGRGGHGKARVAHLLAVMRDLVSELVGQLAIMWSSGI